MQSEEGADVIAVDLCDQIESVAYPMARPADLDDTVNLVEKTGRRTVAEQADVRDFDRLKSVAANGVAELGRLDFVIANAGIAPFTGAPSHSMSAFPDAVDVMLKGVYFTIEAALPAMLEHGDAGAIVITSRQLDSSLSVLLSPPPRASRTCSSRLRPNGVKSPETCTAEALISLAMPGIRFSGRPRVTKSLPSRSSRSCRNESHLNCSRRGPHDASSRGSSTNTRACRCRRPRHPARVTNPAAAGRGGTTTVSPCLPCCPQPRTGGQLRRHAPDHVID